VLVYVPTGGDDDVEMAEEFYQHYAIAPVIAWVAGEDLTEDFIKERFNDKSQFVKANADELAQAVEYAVKWCKQKYDDVFE
jgi:hypothetical protein